MRIVRYDKIPDDENLRCGWNAVAMQMERPEVFYTWEWAAAMQIAYRDSLNAMFLLGYEGDRLVGIASLAVGSRKNDIGFLSATTADYCDFLSSPELREEFLEAVFGELKKASVARLTLANLPADSRTIKVLSNAAKTNGYHDFVRNAYLCAQVQLGASDARQELKNSLIGKKKIRRYLRAMEREGSVSFTHLRSYEQIQAALLEFAEAHVARFAATGRTSSLATAERKRFLEELARRFDGSGVVTLSQLRIQDQPIAWNFGFRFHRSWFWYQPTFDSRYEENSPGHCLLSRIVTEACDAEELEVVDMGLGAEGYKERFGNATRQTLHITLSRSWADHAREVFRYRAASAIKQSPKAEAAVRRLLGR